MPSAEARAHRRKLAGIVLCVWLAGAIVGGAVAWVISQHASQTQTAEIRTEVRASLNPLICLFRSFVIPTRARAAQAVKDETQSASARQRAAGTVKTDDRILHALITIPPGFDCTTLK